MSLSCFLWNEISLSVPTKILNQFDHDSGFKEKKPHKAVATQKHLRRCAFTEDTRIYQISVDISIVIP